MPSRWRGRRRSGRRGPDREVYWHGVQGGRGRAEGAAVAGRAKPRLRKKRPRAGESGEVEIPAYAALQVEASWTCWWSTSTGIQFGDYHVLAAVGVDATGRKHVLSIFMRRDDTD